MEDSKLLEFAGRAAGETYNQENNPLERDDLALRLAVQLKIDVAHTNIHSPQVHALADAKVQVWEDSSTDPYAATRRAIVRAAAEIGRGMA